METSASRSAEKKDKMDGSGFPDLPKKPSETRGNTPIWSGNGTLNVVSGSVVSVVVVVGGAGVQVESRSHRLSLRRAKGEPTQADEIYISKR